MNVEHRTSNVEHRIMYSTIIIKTKRHAAQAPALRERFPHSTFDVECSMFKLLHLKLRLNLHITLKFRIQVRSSEINSPMIILLSEGLKRSVNHVVFAYHQLSTIALLFLFQCQIIICFCCN